MPNGRTGFVARWWDLEPFEISIGRRLADGFGSAFSVLGCYRSFGIPVVPTGRPRGR